MQTDLLLSKTVTDFARMKLVTEFWPRVCKCLDSLTEDQVWWRPNENSNSIGNLLLHVNGNLRQWILVPLGGLPDERDRDAEFAERRRLGTDELRRNLEQTLHEVDAVVGRQQSDDLVKTYTIQRYENMTALAAIFHVTEHFAMHFGQILYITKLLTGTDLGFFKHLENQKQ